jgi:delta 1-pyrroline-5-carboxylate dehydrogenase
MQGEAKPIAQATMGETTEHGSFFAPRAWEIDSIDRLHKEVFGPALHVVRWKGDELDKVIDAINATGYGLTLGIHSRIDETIDHIVSRVKVGNAYVNRNQIGAVVGVQPFGGQGPERHRPEGRRPALPAALRHREDGDGEHDRRRRQRIAADAGRIAIEASAAIAPKLGAVFAAGEKLRGWHATPASKFSQKTSRSQRKKSPAFAGLFS